MEATKTAEVSEQAGDSLEALRQRFEQWRQGRRQGERIPAAMWVAAVKEARTRSVYRVARALRLDYAMLKLRAQRPGKARGAAPSNQVAPRFVELSRNSFQVIDQHRIFQADCGCSRDAIGTICMPSFAARCDSARSTRSR